MGVKYLVDTNIVSELMKAEPSQAVIHWFYDHYGEIYLNAITVKELYFGMFRLPDGKRKRNLDEAITGIVMDGAEKTLPFDSFSAYLCARLHDRAIRAGKTPAIEDLMIAAIALRNDCVLATHNVKDFDYLEIPVEDPFDHRIGEEA